MKLTPEESLRRKRARAREYQRKHKEEHRARNRKSAHKHRLAIRARQGARRIAQQEAAAGRPKPEHCEVCGDTENIHFDHCHQRGVFRGWLCHHCNTVLGLIKEDPNRLRMLAAYLERTANIIPPQLTLPGI